MRLIYRQHAVRRMFGRLRNEETIMKCPICKHGETRPGLTTVTLERDGMAVVFRGVPDVVCDNCGETFHDEAVTTALLRQAEQAAAAGVEVDIRRFAVAAR
ncbi:MAG: type II toxin-antitoxin system MqsA family antitoxin [Rhodocyclaceae bacterium]|jgi:YgiT-type zinc finger domain-containing protein